MTATRSGCSEPLRLLILSATFPPRGGSGVQRVYYQAEHLRQLGIDVWVITEDAGRTWVADETHVLQGAAAGQVVRIRQFPNRGWVWTSRVVRKVFRRTLYPDDHVGWIPGAHRAASELVRSNAISHVLVSLGHPSALLVGWLLKRAHPRMHLTIDVRDLWVGNPIRLATRTGSFLTRGLSRRIERAAFERASAVFTVSEAIAEEIRRRYPVIGGENVHVVHNGFDDDLFAASRAEAHAAGAIVLRHTGFVVPDQKVHRFLDALTILKQQDPSGLRDVRVEFVGGNPRHVEQFVGPRDLGDIVSCRDYVDHQRAVQLMLGADVLLLFWGPGPGTVGGKFYEYLRADRFILAFDQGNLNGRDLLEESGRGQWVPVDDVAAQVRALQNLIERRRRGEELLQPPLPDISAYCRRHQAARLAGLLQELPPFDAPSVIPDADTICC